MNKPGKIVKYLIFFVSTSCFSVISLAQDPWHALTQKHPRLLLGAKTTEVNIQRALLQQPPLKRVHDVIIKSCEDILRQKPIQRIQIGRRLLSKSREALRRIFQLAYAYRIDGDSRYLKRAEEEMLAISAFSDWNPSHFLDVAEMTMAVSIGYDWLFNDLPASAKKVIKDAIINKGIKPSFDPKYNWFLTAEHNWNQVCNASMSFGALAIAEDEPGLAKQVIERAKETIRKPMATYAPNGGYAEGYGYWEYGTSFNVLLIAALQSALGTDYGLSRVPGFLETAGFQQNMSGPTDLCFNWSDSGKGTDISPAMFWFANALKEPSLLWNEQRYLQRANLASISKNRLLPALILWGSQTNETNIPPPEKLLWVGQGHSPVAMMRTSWKDPDAIYIGLKAGSASVNHAHMDAGSFVLDAMGERWAMDFGMQDYNSLESHGVKLWGRQQNSQRWEVFRYNNYNHNTLTMNGQLQQVDGYAKIDRWSADPRQLFAVTDLSSIYKGQVAAVSRGVAIREQKYAYVRDELTTADKDVTLRWTLLTPAEVRIANDSTIELRQHGKTMYVRFTTENAITIKTWSTDPPHDYDAPNPGTTLTGFETKIPAHTRFSVNAIFSSTPAVHPSILPLAAWRDTAN